MEAAKSTLAGVENTVSALQGTATMTMGTVPYLLGRHDEALARLRKTEAVFEASGSMVNMGRCMLSIAGTRVVNSFGRYQEATQMLTEATSTPDGFKDSQGAVYCNVVMGRVLHNQGRSQDALMPLDEASESLILYCHHWGPKGID
ncbi:hypothetical protein CALVIDRAFT_344233 [Calocera viscosa TUFC12733]|uniref:TPR-like protein n=1 Tax=Calocera viscosa (strain TUFC12733) TaxID=1330018 RepID=A0A167HD82_CALVF|nr:hypothetical protein CALVIDRAFT_344233 [Calocera viscosa TUFC12733]